MVNTGRTTQQLQKTMIGETKYCIVESSRGGGLIILNDDEPMSEIKKTNKYLENTAREIGVSVNILEQAIAKAKFKPQTNNSDKEQENPGAIAVRLIKTNMVDIVQDQLKITYVIIQKTVMLPVEKDTKDGKDTNLPDPYIYENNIKKISNSYNSNSSVFSVSSVFPKTESSNDENKQSEYLKNGQSEIEKDNNPSNTQNKKDTKNSSVSHVKVERLVRLRSEEAKQWISKLYHLDQGKTISEGAIKSAVLVLEYNASQKPRITLHNRVAPDGNGGIWWDMSDERGRAIHITKEGWEIVDNPPHLFRHYSHQEPLGEPAEQGSFLPLLDYILLNDPGHTLLSIITPITYLDPEVPHVVEILGGVKGSTKSGYHRFRKKIVDPSVTPLLTMHKDHDEMVQQADHHYLLCYDNVSKIDEYQSDLMCKIVTGAGFSKRALFTDDDDVIRQLMRIININGIVFPADKPDLLDRAVLQSAAMINDKNRKTIKQMNEKMNVDAPKVIRAMLDVLVIALNLYDTVKPKRNNRMADFTKFGCAVTEAMGINKGYFENAYHDNINTQDEEAVQASPVATWLIDFMESNNHHKYHGSAGEILQAITDFAYNTYNRDLDRTVDDWPRGATPFGRKLKEVIPSLRTVGYSIVYAKGRTRSYVITKIARDDKESGQQQLVKVPKLTRSALISMLKDFESRYSDDPDEPDVLEHEPVESGSTVKTIEVPRSIKDQMDNIFKIMITHFDPIKETVIRKKTGHSTVELRKLLGVLEKDGRVKQIKPGVWVFVEAGQ